MFKKFLITIVSIAVSVAVLIDGYLMFFKHDQSQETAQSQATTASDTESESSTTTSSSTSSSNSTMKDGTYTGKSTSTEWGDVQVKITVASGKITQITVLKHPTGGKSDEINSWSLPTYKQEALAAQSANINQVSGATETYKGFTGSLQSAINQAEE
ncbi:FMN-binding protein [Limosilactobacillus fermentum]|uniref:FMN-binding protein n=1 Tax=Limosilactobacillus fermentum TaxID=1613 RepID=UPI001E5523AE|nr:FMN-binding protein [Limosilactobacillus fermentum]MCC6110762.1 FMN-binding protein [Limosilactobacillus fermentum]